MQYALGKWWMQRRQDCSKPLYSLWSLRCLHGEQRRRPVLTTMHGAFSKRLRAHGNVLPQPEKLKHAHRLAIFVR